MFKVYDKNTRTTSMASFYCLYNFEHISHLFIVFLLLTLKNKMVAAKKTFNEFQTKNS